MTRPLVFVTRQLPGDGLRRLTPEAEVSVWPDEMPPPRDELLRGVRGADAIISLLTDRIDAEVMDASPALRIVSNMAVGHDNIDVPEATRRGIFVANTPGVLTETTADFAWALLLAAARRVVEGDVTTRAGGWKTWHPSFLLGHDVHGATLGIIGLGQIGMAVARRARGFAMRILYHDTSRRPEAEVELGLTYAELDELLAEADLITVHVPLTPETHHLMGEREFRLMKPTAAFVNTSRGPVVDQRALHGALSAARIAAAAIDVTEVEPIPPDDPLLSAPNLIVTPHIASASVATRGKMADMAVDAVLAVLRGEAPTHCVNPGAARTRDGEST
jgi:glyoxylate reductase